MTFSSVIAPLGGGSSMRSGSGGMEAKSLNKRSRAARALMTFFH